jgi:cellulose synthase/poly-beta-1,6-N-acetylglucosamine synthase-like glycosyltransferase
VEILFFIYFLTFSFLLLAIYVYKGYRFESKKQLHSFPKSSLKLSVIIAAKNEEQNINILFNYLENLDYPQENFEVILIDDNSSDKTYSLIQSRITNKDNYKLIKAEKKELEGKKGALDIGIKNAQNNFIVITDADCKPEREWLKAISGKLDAGYDFVFGVAPIESGENLAQNLSAFENLRNSLLSIAAVGLNIPYTASARSFAFRKKSFERLGGYSKTTETISGDDDLLLREAVKNKMLIGTLIDPEALVNSSAPRSFEDYLKQKRRHLKTSFHYLFRQKIFLGAWHLLNLLCLFSTLLIFLSPVLLLPFIVKTFYDLFIVIKFQPELGHQFKFHQIIYLQILFEVFVLINFFNSFSKKTEWK